MLVSVMSDELSNIPGNAGMTHANECVTVTDYLHAWFT